jgi:hypothetical protein
MSGPKIPRVHFKVGERNGVKFMLCKLPSGSVSSYTEDKAKVTCKFCLKAMNNGN